MVSGLFNWGGWDLLGSMDAGCAFRWCSSGAARTMFKYYNLPFRVVNGRHPTSDTGLIFRRFFGLFRFPSVGCGGSPQQCCLVMNHHVNLTSQHLRITKRSQCWRSTTAARKKNMQVMALGLRQPILRELSQDPLHVFFTPTQNGTSKVMNMMNMATCG